MNFSQYSFANLAYNYATILRAKKFAELIQGSTIKDQSQQLKLIDLINTINEQINKINKNIESENQVSIDEIIYITKIILLDDNIEFPKLFVKGTGKLKHSVILYKNSDKYKVLIKPNFSNKDIDNESKNKHLKGGGYKIVKTTGFEITLKKDKPLKSVERIVTHSKDRRLARKNSDLKNKLGKGLEEEGYKEIKFTDNQGMKRIIYTQKYLGEDLTELLPSLTEENRRKIMGQLWSKVQFGEEGTHDIKLHNVLWYEETATLIDFTKKSYTYLTHKQKVSKTINQISRNKQILEIQKRLMINNILHEAKVSHHDITKSNKNFLRNNQYLAVSILFFQLSFHFSAYGEYDALINYTYTFFLRGREHNYDIVFLKSSGPDEHPFYNILINSYAERYAEGKKGERDFREDMEKALKKIWSNSTLKRFNIIS
ncbi:MAG: hypothetical protein ACK5Z5_01820 [Neisseriaceae bacterium]